MNGLVSEEYYVVPEESLLDFSVGLPLGSLPDSLPELDFEVDQQLTDFNERRHSPQALQQPLSERGPPERRVDPGKYDFQVEINSSHTHKKKYVVSHKLNRIYVDKDIDFPVQFSWRGPAHMYVRATCVYADAAQQEKRVERCLNHFHSSTYADPTVSRNVLHSSRPPGTAGVQYCGAPDAADSWLSVRVALHKPGAEAAHHAYRFTCKNSCASGINRRPILIIFTLEDQFGAVVGRQQVGARVCACPRRDMIKDEESEGAPRGGKRRAAPAHLPPSTKVKRENNDDTVIDLNLQLMSPQAAVLGLEVMIKMEEQANEARRDQRACDVINALKHTQQELKNKYPQAQ